jgi:hypothetical protein
MECLKYDRFRTLLISVDHRKLTEVAIMAKFNDQIRQFEKRRNDDTAPPPLKYQTKTRQKFQCFLSFPMPMIDLTSDAVTLKIDGRSSI